MPEAKFNLIDEKWIPITGNDKVSLLDIFSDEKLKAIGGNARQKIALLKLLLAIAQAAHTPATQDEWKRLGKEGLALACMDYLEKWHDKFYLYGDEPFLQMPVQKAKADSPGNLQPEIATGNNLRLTHLQCERNLENADLALLLLTEMSMCLGGKKYDRTCVLAPNHTKRTAPPGPGTGARGYLHSFLTGGSIIETVWLNLLSMDDIRQLTTLPSGLGQPPWEKMPTTETDEIAENLRNSLQGRLVPMARFCLLEGDKIHFTEGITPKSAQECTCDPSAASKSDGKSFKMLWADPDKRPWRSLSALLSFLNADSNKGFDCFLLKRCVNRIKDSEQEQLGIWSGGMKVSGTSGEQKVSGSDDVVESEIQLCPEEINRAWFGNFSSVMEWLENLAKTLYGCIMSYMRDFSAENNGAAGAATALFWEQSENYLPSLIIACSPAKRKDLPQVQAALLHLVYKCYDEKCPFDTPRQIKAWALHRPRIKLPSAVIPDKPTPPNPDPFPSAPPENGSGEIQNLEHKLDRKMVQGTLIP